jgi:hypothetical protein
MTIQVWLKQGVVCTIIDPKVEEGMYIAAKFKPDSGLYPTVVTSGGGGLSLFLVVPS